VDNPLREDQAGRARLQNRREEVWKPPRAGWVKMNTDAGFCRDSGAASAGIVVRDHTGFVLLSAWKTLWRCGSPEEAEAEACLKGICLVEEWIKQPTVVESDCQLLVKTVIDAVARIRAVAQLLPAYIFKHARRESNEVAHQLVQQALRMNE
jgi:hypothetical protein